MSLAEDVAPAAVRAPAPGEQRFLINGIDWSTYEQFVELLGEHHVRLTYDQGVLELMSPSPSHEVWKYWLGRFIETIAEELGVPIAPAGSMTFRRKDLEKGLEPDQCFWIAHERQIRGRLDIDPQFDPPPDLVIEVEFSRGALDRMRIYAALGVPEVWCYDGESLRIHRLTNKGEYEPCDESPSFPGIPPDGIVSFLQGDPQIDYLTVVRNFRQWVRERLGAT